MSCKSGFIVIPSFLNAKLTTVVLRSIRGANPPSRVGVKVKTQGMTFEYMCTFKSCGPIRIWLTFNSLCVQIITHPISALPNTTGWRSTFLSQCAFHVVENLPNLVGYITCKRPRNSSTFSGLQNNGNQYKNYYSMKPCEEKWFKTDTFHTLFE